MNKVDFKGDVKLMKQSAFRWEYFGDLCGFLKNMLFITEFQYIFI